MIFPVVKVENGKLIVELPLDPNPKPSSTGKTLVVASTHGNFRTSTNDPATGKPITVGVNAFVKKD